MKDLLRTILPRIYRKDVVRSAEMTQEQAFAAVFGELVSQGKPLLKRTDRQALRGSKMIINKPPGLKNQGQLENNETIPFTMIDATAFLWNELPTAVAYGSVEGDNNLVLTGGVHHPQTLSEYQIDPKTPYRFSSMVREFPGHFLFPMDYLAFFIAQPSNSLNLGVLTGDFNPDSWQGFVIELSDLQNPTKKKDSLQKITTFIKTQATQKFR